MLIGANMMLGNRDESKREMRSESEDCELKGRNKERNAIQYAINHRQLRGGIG